MITLAPQPISSFENHVLHVVALCAEEQMIWSNARRSIAAVQNEKPFRNGSVSDDPGESMRKYWVSVAFSDATVSTWAGIASPQPTTEQIIGFIDVPCEPFSEWRRFKSMPHGVTLLYEGN